MTFIERFFFFSIYKKNLMIIFSICHKLGLKKDFFFSLKIKPTPFKLIITIHQICFKIFKNHLNIFGNIVLSSSSKPHQGTHLGTMKFSPNSF
jgi:hypothetical protein